MNRENFKQVLDVIKAHPESWDQWAVWHGHCGTTHCFGGHAEILSGVDSEASDGGIFVVAKEWLELTEDEAQYIFEPERTMDDFEEFYRTGDCRYFLPMANPTNNP